MTKHAMMRIRRARENHEIARPARMSCPPRSAYQSREPQVL